MRLILAAVAACGFLAVASARLGSQTLDARAGCQLNCEQCLQRADCGWCWTSKTRFCMGGSEDGPLDHETSCTSWFFVSDDAEEGCRAASQEQPGKVESAGAVEAKTAEEPAEPIVHDSSDEKSKEQESWEEEKEKKAEKAQEKLDEKAEKAVEEEEAKQEAAESETESLREKLDEKVSAHQEFQSKIDDKIKEKNEEDVEHQREYDLVEDTVSEAAKRLAAYAKTAEEEGRSDFERQREENRKNNEEAAAKRKEEEAEKAAEAERELEEKEKQDLEAQSGDMAAAREQERAQDEQLREMAEVIHDVQNSRKLRTEEMKTDVDNHHKEDAEKDKVTYNSDMSKATYEKDEHYDANVLAALNKELSLEQQCGCDQLYDAGVEECVRNCKAGLGE